MSARNANAGASARTIVSHGRDAETRLAARTRYPREVHSIVRSPYVSVRQTRTPARCRRAIVSGLGWPKSFPVPTLTSASPGVQPARPTSVRPFLLPWCGTLRTSAWRSNPLSAIPCCAASSASPVRTMVVDAVRTSSTMLVSFVPMSSGASAAGHSTRTLARPTRHDVPAWSSRISTFPRGVSRGV